MKFNETYDLIISGKKICTTRVPAYKWFKWYKNHPKKKRVVLAESKDGRIQPIRITAVTEPTFGHMKKKYYREEGFDSPEEFVEVWTKLHGKFNSRRKVCVIHFELATIEEYRKQKRRKPVVVPKSGTKPELIFKNKVVKKVLPNAKFVTNSAFKTRFNIYPFFPDGKFLDFPLIWEIDGVRWHSRKKQKAKDEARNACFTASGYYVYRVTDQAINGELEKVEKDFARFVDEIRKEKYGKPKVKHYENN